MPGMSFPMHVEMEDGTEYDVMVEQRDIGAWEREPFGCSFRHAQDQKQVNFLRYIAWHALRRTGEIDKKTGWSAFDDRCVEAVDTQPEGEAGGVANPTAPDTSGEI